jgi:phenylalanyl-tRNA synthetase beta subunit
LAEKLSRYGLETEVTEHENNLYLKFSPFPNRPDLLSGWGIIQEIGVIFNCQIIKPISSFSIQSHQDKEIKIPKREKIGIPNDYLIVKVNQEKPVKVAITTPDCYEFCLGLIKNIEIKENPVWIKE